MKLTWKEHDGYRESILHDFYDGDGVRFSVYYRPTCYRRGPWRLLIEVAHEHHNEWGCFDDADQPERNYHHLSNMESEANAIAEVLFADRFKKFKTESEQHGNQIR